ncbi:MAG: hypothetical protein IPK75_17960 [Acidobacteria bacterium]|nr:hypothetical protein [Acidobacteriota bacterium]
MSDTLEMLLMRLAGLKQVALTRWAEQQQDDDDFELGEDYQPWLALESDVNDIWICSYCVRVDEATERIIQEAGATPLAAAQAHLYADATPYATPIAARGTVGLWTYRR